MIDAADGREDALLATGGDAGVAGGAARESTAVSETTQVVSGAGAGERERSPAVQRTRRRSAPASTSPSSPKSRTKSAAAASATATQASPRTARPRKKPALDGALQAGDAAGAATGVAVKVDDTAAPAHGTLRPQRQTPAPTKSSRRTPPGTRKRGSAVAGPTESARMLSEWQALLASPDALFSALPALRQAILNRPLDEALQLVADGLALALAPSAARIWIADMAPWSASASRVGGSGLAPGLRLRACAMATERDRLADVAAPVPPASAAGEAVTRDPLLDEVASARQLTLLFDAVGHPLSRAWSGQIGPGGATLPSLGTLAAYPLLARGQFLGVLAVGSAGRLSARQLAALEELVDLVALAADRDRLLSYSRSSEALAQTVVRHAPVAMALITGVEYTLALANPAFALLLGVEAGTPLAGRRLAEVIHDRAHAVAASLRLDAAYAGDQPQAMVELPMRRESRVTYWNVTTSPVAGVAGGGALVAAVEVTWQVMARQRAQDSAEVAEERLRQMMSLHAASLAVASQLDADPRELLTDLLDRSIALLGALAGVMYVRDPRRDTLDVVVSHGLRQDYSGRRLEPGVGLAGQVARARRGLMVDDYRRSPFGTGPYIEETASAVIAVPLIHHNDVVGVLEVLDDAERRTFSDADLWLLELFAAQAAQAIQNARMYVELERAYRKQRELDRLKDDFIATASHELRTPLTGVQGFLELLLDLPAARADPMVHTFAQKAANAAEELTDIAERLLQTSRLDTGRMVLHTAPVRLAPLAAEVLSAFRDLRAVREGAHELRAQVDAEARVMADPARLKEILDNLVSNAIKYSPKGGPVVVGCEPFGGSSRAAGHDVPPSEEAIAERPTVVLPPLTRDTDAPDSPSQPRQQMLVAAETQPFFVLSVRDHGMGIPQSERAKLFGRFARLDGARVSQIRGTGLGLYICRQLARSMGGDVWLAESEPGVGSVFAVALPAAPESFARRGDAPSSAG